MPLPILGCPRDKRRRCHFHHSGSPFGSNLSWRGRDKSARSKCLLSPPTPPCVLVNRTERQRCKWAWMVPHVKSAMISRVEFAYTVKSRPRGDDRFWWIVLKSPFSLMTE